MSEVDRLQSCFLKADICLPAQADVPSVFEAIQLARDFWTAGLSLERSILTKERAQRIVRVTRAADSLHKSLLDLNTHQTSAEINFFEKHLSSQHFVEIPELMMTARLQLHLLARLAHSMSEIGFEATRLMKEGDQRKGDPLWSSDTTNELIFLKLVPLYEATFKKSPTWYDDAGGSRKASETIRFIRATLEFFGHHLTDGAVMQIWRRHASASDDR